VCRLKCAVGLDRGQIQLKAEQALQRAELKADLAELRLSVMDQLYNMERSLEDGQSVDGPHTTGRFR
jgi:hypothetical protein